MSTSYGSEAGLVYIDDEPDAIRASSSAPRPTPGARSCASPDKPGISNLIEILAVARGSDPAEVEREFAGAGYGDFKQAVGEAVVELLAPVRERYRELRPDEQGLEGTLAAGAERAREIARATMAEVREAMGIGPPR